MIQLPQLPNLHGQETLINSPAEDVLSLFVSDLPQYATEEDLYNVFHFPMDHLPGDALGRVYIYPFYVTEIRMVSGVGGTSKYAFVRFPSIAERTRGLYIMQGVLCMGRPIRLSRAHAKDRARGKSDLVLFTNPRNKEERQRDNIVIDQFNSQWAAVDPKNTKVFVGGISPRVLLQDVVGRFAVMGTITNVNFGKGCAFISFARKPEAAHAIKQLDGLIMDGRPLRVTWSRSSVQPLLQQQRTLVTPPIANPTPPTSSSGGSTPEPKFESKYLSHSPTSPKSPLTPLTPFGCGVSFPQLTPTQGGRKLDLRGTRSGSVSSRPSISLGPSLYSLREVDETHSLTFELAPNLARRKTLANIFREEVHASSMARRTSLPDNAL